MRLLRITEPDADALAMILEMAVQEAHEATLSQDETERAEGADGLEVALRLLREVDDESPVFDVSVKPGIPVDWDYVFGDEDAEPTADQPEMHAEA